MKEDTKIRRLFEVVEAVTGVTRNAIVSHSRVREHYFARMIVAYHLYRYGYAVTKIRYHMGTMAATSVLRQIKGYRNERTPYFRNCAKRVEEILSSETEERDYTLKGHKITNINSISG